MKLSAVSDTSNVGVLPAKSNNLAASATLIGPIAASAVACTAALIAKASSGVAPMKLSAVSDTSYAGVLPAKPNNLAASATLIGPVAAPAVATSAPLMAATCAASAAINASAESAMLYCVSPEFVLSEIAAACSILATVVATKSCAEPKTLCISGETFAFKSSMVVCN